MTIPKGEHQKGMLQLFQTRRGGIEISVRIPPAFIFEKNVEGMKEQVPPQEMKVVGPILRKVKAKEGDRHAQVKNSR